MVVFTGSGERGEIQMRVNVDEAIKTVDKFKLHLQDRFDETLKQMADVLVDEIKDVARASFKHEPTEYLDSFNVEFRSIKGGSRIIITNNSSYATTLEFGHSKEISVPLVRGGVVTALGQWAIKHKGFRLKKSKKGNLYLVNERGKRMHKFDIKMEGNSPFRFGYYKALPKIRDLAAAAARGVGRK